LRNRPAILGALLDAVARGLKCLSETKLPGLPRMADFALWATACEKREKDAPSAFWAAYAGNREHAVEDVLEADSVATAVRDWMKDREEWGPDTATELLRVLSDRVGERAAKSKGWPSAANALSGRLHRAATNLRKVGIEVVFERESRGGPRRITIVHSPKPQGQTDYSGDDPGDDGDDPYSSATKDRRPPKPLTDLWVSGLGDDGDDGDDLSPLPSGPQEKGIAPWSGRLWTALSIKGSERGQAPASSPSSPSSALQAALRAGVSVSVEGNDLVLNAAREPPLAVLEMLAREKPGVVALLKKQRVVEWLNSNPVCSSPERCCWCGAPERIGSVLLPFGVGPHA
jgi:hypothetical protein